MNRAVVQINDSLGKGQSQSVAGRRTGCVSLIELFVDAVHDISSHAGTVINYGNLDRVLLLTQQYADSAPVRNKFYGIADEVLPNLSQQVFVSAADNGIKVDIEVKILHAPLRFVHQNNFSKLFIQGIAFFFYLDFLIFQS